MKCFSLHVHESKIHIVRIRKLHPALTIRNNYRLCRPKFFLNANRSIPRKNPSESWRSIESRLVGKGVVPLLERVHYIQGLIEQERIWVRAR